MSVVICCSQLIFSRRLFFFAVMAASALMPACKEEKKRQCHQSQGGSERKGEQFWKKSFFPLSSFLTISLFSCGRERKEGMKKINSSTNLNQAMKFFSLSPLSFHDSEGKKATNRLNLHQQLSWRKGGGRLIFVPPPPHGSFRSSI